MLYKTLLLLHMFGLTVGAGTGFYIAAVGRHAARNMEQAEARTLIPGINGAISKLGTVGLALLLVSGTGLAWVMGPAVLTVAFQIKMVLVALIVAFVGAMHYLAARTRRTADIQAAQTMRKLGPLGPLLAVATLIAAVMAFH